jgi:hypothetical protein
MYAHMDESYVAELLSRLPHIQVQTLLKVQISYKFVSFIS